MAQTKQPIYHILLFIFVYLSWGAEAEAHRSRKLTETEIDYLVLTCVNNGFNPEYLKSIFSDRRLKYVPGLVRQNMVTKEKEVYYQRFLDPAAVGMARKFAGKWRTLLKQTNEVYGVDREVVVAILLVETSLGKVLGHQPTLSIFASMVLENRDGRRREVSKSIPDKAQRQHYLDRLEKKALWARQELLALLTMEKEGKINIFELKGSYAGAFGISQFLPSSYLKWGKVGAGSKTVNLFYMPDAIVSVFNYLKEHGWKSGLQHESNRKVIWMYNNSRPYVDAVLHIAMKLQTTE